MTRATRSVERKKRMRSGGLRRNVGIKKPRQNGERNGSGRSRQPSDRTQSARWMSFSLDFLKIILLTSRARCARCWSGARRRSKERWPATTPPCSRRSSKPIRRRPSENRSPPRDREALRDAPRLHKLSARPCPGRRPLPPIGRHAVPQRSNGLLPHPTHRAAAGRQRYTCPNRAACWQEHPIPATFAENRGKRHACGRSMGFQTCCRAGPLARPRL
jgi:hypothetical protein